MSLIILTLEITLANPSGLLPAGFRIHCLIKASYALRVCTANLPKKTLYLYRELETGQAPSILQTKKDDDLVF